MSRRAAKLITPGNLEDDLDKAGACDWIIEAVVEDVAVKHTLYERLERVLKPGAVVSSNTSTIPLQALLAGRSQAFQSAFLITHFFNPPRYMRLLELVAGPQTAGNVTERIRVFCDVHLGKGVVACKDTPGFVANRIGALWIQAALNEAVALGLSVEEADAIAGRPMGVPKTGVFGLLDLVGIDLVPRVRGSMVTSLPESDAYCAIARELPIVTKMLADGLVGRKGPGGFYRLRKQDGRRVKEAIDLQTGAYRTSRKAKPDCVAAATQNPNEGSLRALVDHDSDGGRYAWAVLSQTIVYAASLVPEVCDSLASVDEAMRLGYNWSQGPFELADRLGADWLIARLEGEGTAVPPLLRAAQGRSFYGVIDGRLHHLTPDGAYAPLVRPDGVILLADIKCAGEPLARNSSAALWDIGDGVTCFEFTSKMNTLDEQTLAALTEAIEITGHGYRAMVIYNEGANFSVGANVGAGLFAANLAMWDRIEAQVKAGQDLYKAMKYAPFPVVGAPSGMALGGGCEILLHCDALQAHAETYMGLVEVGVGLVPAWGGCKEMLLRHLTNPKRPGGPMPAVNQAFQQIGLAAVSKSAAEAVEMLYVRPQNRISMNRDRLLADAKALALSMADGYSPPVWPEEGVRLPGRTAEAALHMAVDGLVRQGKATPYDEVVGKRLAHVLSGGDTDIVDALDEDALLALERAVFMTLIREPRTLERIEHMLETGKPLRN